MNVLLRWVAARRLFGGGARSVVALLGVALGVGVFVAIRLASHSAMASFADTVDGVAGRAELSITGSSEGFDERHFVTVATAPGVAAAAPIVEAWARVEARGRPPETVLVLGVDPLREPPFARWTPDGGASRGEALALMGGRRGAAVAAAFAERRGLARGDTLRLVVSGHAVDLEVVAVIAGGALDQAAGGNVIVMDVASAQEVFDRVGRLDRIDVRSSEAGDGVARRLASRLPPSLAVGPPRTRTRQVQDMVRAFDLNLTALSFVALFVATFLVFNAVSVSALHRRREIGLLRALGATRGQVAATFVVEGVAVGLAGSLLGLAAGRALAHGALTLVSRTLEDLYRLPATPSLRFDTGIDATGVAIGTATALVAALAPAWEASTVAPGIPLRVAGAADPRPLAAGRWGLAGVAVLALAAGLSWWTVTAHRPLAGFGAAFLVLAGLSMLAPLHTRALGRAVEGPAWAVGGVAAALGLRGVRDALLRSSVVVAALMVSVGMAVAMTIMIGSFRRTVDVWITQSVRGDLYVEPVGRREGAATTRLDPEWLSRVASVPGVAALDTYRASRHRLDGGVVTAIGVDFDVQRRHGRLQLVRGDLDDALARATRDGGVLASESFARRRGVREGDRIAFPAESGVVALPVTGLYYDYSTDAGALMMDRALYVRLTGADRVESVALYLAPGATETAVRAAVTALSDSLQLVVLPNRTLRSRVLTVFDQTFQITWALQLVAVVVAMLGVVGTLTALVVLRAREIGILRAAGATRGQVRTMVLAESALLGLAGATAGCVTGVAMAMVLIHVINQEFFGWTIRTAIDPRVFVQALALMLATALMAGLGPARQAAGRSPAEAMRAE